MSTIVDMRWGPSNHKMVQGALPCPHAKSEFTGSPAYAGDDNGGGARAARVSPYSSPGRKELDQRLLRRLRRLLGEIVPAVERKSAHVARPFAPGRERPLGLGRDAAGGAPDRQQRAD